MSLSHGVKNFRTFTYNFSKYALKFNSDELKGMIGTVLVLAFVYSFNQWGDETFDFVAGLLNLFTAVIFIFIALVIMQFGQRIAAIYYGYDPEYEFNLLGVLMCLIVAFASRGAIVIFMPGNTRIHHLMASRLGEFRYYTSTWEWAKIAFAGIFFNLIVAILFTLTPYNEVLLLNKFLKINLWFAIFSLIPLPKNPGFYMFFTHKNFWAFGVGFVVGGAILMFFTNPLIAIVGSFVSGTLFIYWWFFKKDKLTGMEYATFD